MWPRRARALVPFVGLGFGLFVLHKMVNLGSVFEHLQEADPAWLAAAVGLNLLAPLVVAGKVWAFVRLAGERAGLRRCWSAVMAAVALNAALPGRGGDLVRAVFLAESRAQVPQLLGVVLLERLADVFTLGLLSLAAAALGGASVATPLALGACLASAGLVGGLAFGHRLPWKAELLERVGRAARRIPRHPGLAGLGTALSLLSWVVNVALMGTCLRAVGVDVDAIAIVRAAPVAILAGILPLTVGGIGTRDTALVLLLGAGVDGGQVAAGALLYTAIALWLQGLLGLGALGRETLRRTRMQVEQERAASGTAT